MKRLFALFPVLIFNIIIFGCVPLDQGSTTGSTYSSGPKQALVLANRVYKPSIHTVQLYPRTGQELAPLNPSIISTQQDVPLTLSFDDLRPDYEQYQVKLIHCNWNWEESRLSNIQYLYDYNEFPITDYEFSQNSRIPYVHYRFKVPRVKLSGNYVLVVYRNNDPSDLVLSRRFVIYTSQARINPSPQLPSGSVERRENQQINFTLNFNSVPNVLDPANQIKIVIRKNQRWDNAIMGLKPTSIRAGLFEMEYKNFDQTNQFKGGNEYRFFDLRTVQARGQNVSRVTRDSVGFEAFLVPNKIRSGNTYGQIQDINGQYIIANAEYPEPSISAEYVDVHFFLAAESPLPEPVYVAGEFSSYLPVPPYLMRYDPEAKGYLADILLKQGWYNYLFLLKSERNPYALEGSYAETENQYEIIVYYRPAGEIYDAAIGYTSFSSQR